MARPVSEIFGWNRVFFENAPRRLSEDGLRGFILYNIPVATNIATAEVLVMALDRGDLDWREVMNPRSEYNRRRK